MRCPSEATLFPPFSPVSVFCRREKLRFAWYCMLQAPKGHLHAEIPSFQSVIISVSPREVARLGAQSTSLMTGSNSLGPFRGPLPAREKRVTSRGWLTLLTSHEPCSGTVILLMSAWFMRGEKGAPSGACTVMRVRF